MAHGPNDTDFYRRGDLRRQDFQGPKPGEDLSATNEIRD
jgi:hypothetical protein